MSENEEFDEQTKALMERLDAYEKEYGGTDTDVGVWAIRACGMIYTFITHPEIHTHEDVLEGMERLASKAPSELIVAVALNAPAVSAAAEERVREQDAEWIFGEEDE